MSVFSGESADRLEDRAAELDADNHQLRRRISDLETELRDATDSLQAARAANRDLMSMLNRGSSNVRLPSS